jgi:hypothetical protein
VSHESNGTGLVSTAPSKAISPTPGTLLEKLRESSPELCRFALDHEGKLVLGVLANSPRTRFTAVKIRTVLKRRLSEKTIRHRLNMLLAAGFVEREQGPKSGTAITESGKKLYQQSEAEHIPTA